MRNIKLKMWYSNSNDKNSVFFFDTFVNLLVKSYEYKALSRKCFLDSVEPVLLQERKFAFANSSMTPSVKTLFTFNGGLVDCLYRFPRKVDKKNFSFNQFFNPTNKFYYDFVSSTATPFSRLPTFLFMNPLIQNTYNWFTRRLLFRDLLVSTCIIDFRFAFWGLQESLWDVYNGDFTTSAYYLTRPYNFDEDFIDKNIGYVSPDNDEVVDFSLVGHRFEYEQIDAFVYDDTFGYRAQPWFLEWAAHSSQFPPSLFMFSKFYDIIFSNTVVYINFFNSKVKSSVSVRDGRSKSSSKFAKINNCVDSGFVLDLPLYFLNVSLLKRYSGLNPLNCNVNLQAFFWSSRFNYIRSIVFLVWELYFNLLDMFVFSHNALYFFFQKFPTDIRINELDFSEIFDIFSKELNISAINSLVIDAFAPAFDSIKKKFFKAFKFKFLTKKDLCQFLENFLFSLSLVLRKISVYKLQHMYEMLLDYSAFILNSFTAFNYLDSNFQTGLLNYLYYLLNNSKAIVNTSSVSTKSFSEFRHRYFSAPTREVPFEHYEGDLSVIYDRKFIGEGYTFFDNPHMFISQFEFFFRNFAQFEYFSSFEINLFSFVRLMLSDSTVLDQQIQHPQISSIFNFSGFSMYSGKDVVTPNVGLFTGLNNNSPLVGRKYRFILPISCSFKFRMDVDKAVLYCLEQCFDLIVIKFGKLFFRLVYGATFVFFISVTVFNILPQFLKF